MPPAEFEATIINHRVSCWWQPDSNPEVSGNPGEIPKISPLVRKWMPQASEAELMEATENWRAYLLLVYQIYQRLKREGRLPLGGDGDVGRKK